MLVEIRKKLIGWLGAKGGAAILVGSYITVDGEKQVAIELRDGWARAGARLSPDGARKIAEQLKVWADTAERGNATHQWQAIIKYAIHDKTAPAEIEDVPVSSAP